MEAKNLYCSIATTDKYNPNADIISLTIADDSNNTDTSHVLYIEFNDFDVSTIRNEDNEDTLLAISRKLFTSNPEIEDDYRKIDGGSSDKLKVSCYLCNKLKAMNIMCEFLIKLGYSNKDIRIIGKNTVSQIGSLINYFNEYLVSGYNNEEVLKYKECIKFSGLTRSIDYYENFVSILSSLGNKEQDDHQGVFKYINTPEFNAGPTSYILCLEFKFLEGIVSEFIKHVNSNYTTDESGK